MSLAQPETYIPKCNKSWNRIPNPWTLKTLALKSILRSLSCVKHPLRQAKGAEFREYLAENLLPEFFDDLIRVAHFNMLKPESMVNVLHAVPPRVYATCVDLLGFYEGTECCKPDSSLNWIFGFLPDICLGTSAMTKLVNLLLKLDLSKIQTIRLWAKDRAIKDSYFPHVLTKVVNLTSLTIRGDVNDHFLRVLGSTCHSLRSLDVERSSKITRLGLFNMVLQKAISGRTPFIPIAVMLARDRRPIAASLQYMSLTIGNIGLDNLEIMARLLNSYLATTLPEAKMFKFGSTMGQDLFVGSTVSQHLKIWSAMSQMLTPGSTMSQHLDGGSTTGQNLAAGSTTGQHQRSRVPQTLVPLEFNLPWSPALEVIDLLRVKFANWMSHDLWPSVRDILTFTLLHIGDCQLDVYRSPIDQSLFIYAHRTSGQFLHVFYKVAPSVGVTHLTSYWDTFTWDVGQVCQLSDIVVHAPNLENLQGRITGIWAGANQIFPRLTRVQCWILDDATLISMLQLCPNLKYLDIKNVRAVEHDPNDPPLPILNDEMLSRLFQVNPDLWPNMIEFLVRPTNLTKQSALDMTKMCPKLLRLGDLECWDITTDEIKELNKILFNSRSQCSLVVLSFPPQRNF